MKLIFAQGNPGPSYESTRHNIGFAVLDEVAKNSSLTFADKSKFQASIAETLINGEKVLFAKPLTFYNETGVAARSIADFYKLDPSTDVVVIHDELALPFGTIKTRLDGSDAGNNGIKSLNRHLGSRYARIRIGIYNQLRDQINDADFVLGKFTREEREALPAIITQAAKYVSMFISDELTSTKVTLSFEQND